MNIFAPNYYNNFKCIADKCKHNCCIGWEIDIDNKTEEYYRSISGEFGKRLELSISCSDDCTHFILAHNDRCPFLNENNLCDIITTLGEDSLCDICTDHPRFRNFFSNHTEIGLGICCEAAGEIILSMQEKMKILPLSPCDVSVTDEESVFISLRNNIFDIIQDRTFSLSERIENLMFYINSDINIADMTKWLSIYVDLERLDPQWDSTLSRLAMKSYVSEKWDTAFEQLLCYFLYRHLPDGIYDGMLSERINFCILSLSVIRHICGTYAELNLSDIIEVSRQYSSEIEYSEENIEKILNVL